MSRLLRNPVASSTLVRSLALVAVVGVVLLLLSDGLSPYRDLQLSYGAYYFCVLAGLTVLAGSSGQISLGHGAFMAVGAYTVAKLGNAGWAVLPELAASAVITLIIGIPVGVAASRLRGPYLAGATLAFAVGLPAVADRFPSAFGGENGLTINPPIHPGWLGANFPLERWEAWIACIGALVVLFVFYNVTRSGIGRALRAVRDDEIAASLSGLHVGRWQTFAFALSAAAAGLGGGLLAVVTQTVAPGAFQLQLSLSLLAGVVIGGLGSLIGAMWGAILLVFLPNWTTDVANSFSLSTNVQHNLPLAVYGVVLIVAMLAWPTGIQGALRTIARAVGPAIPGIGRSRILAPTRAGPAHGTAAPDATAGTPSGGAAETDPPTTGAATAGAAGSAPPGAAPAETGATPAETRATPAETGATPAETGATPAERQ